MANGNNINFNEPEKIFQRANLDLAHESHPERGLLNRYLKGMALPQGALNLSNETDLISWTSGSPTWTDSSVSMHVMSCAHCRAQIKQLRTLMEKEISERRSSEFWQRLEERLVPKGLRTLKRPALALLLMVFFVAVLFFVQQPDKEKLGINSVQNGGAGNSSTTDRVIQVSARLF